MKSLFVFALMVLSVFAGCSVSRIEGLSVSKIETIEKQCSTNQHIEKVHIRDWEYVVKCQNGVVFYSDIERTASLGNKFFNKAELDTCRSTCKENEGLERINVEQTCVKSRAIGRAFVCDEYEDTVTCSCSNGAEKVMKHLFSPGK